MLSLSALVVHPWAVRGGPRRRDGGDAHRWRRHELGEVDPVHLRGVLRHDVLDHVDPAAEPRRADVARNLVVVVLQVDLVLSPRLRGSDTENFNSNCVS